MLILDRNMADGELLAKKRGRPPASESVLISNFDKYEENGKTRYRCKFCQDSFVYSRAFGHAKQCKPKVSRPTPQTQGRCTSSGRSARHNVPSRKMSDGDALVYDHNADPLMAEAAAELAASQDEVMYLN